MEMAKSEHARMVPDVILDNKTGFIYLKANGRTNEPFYDYIAYLKQMERNKVNR